MASDLILRSVMASLFLGVACTATEDESLGALPHEASSGRPDAGGDAPPSVTPVFDAGLSAESDSGGDSGTAPAEAAVFDAATPADAGSAAAVDAAHAQDAARDTGRAVGVPVRFYFRAAKMSRCLAIEVLFC
jgi:hypothetical protein